MMNGDEWRTDSIIFAVRVIDSRMPRYIKVIRGRAYWYEQTYRPGSRTPLTRYIGPVEPKRKKIGLSDVLKGIFEAGLVLGARNIIPRPPRAGRGKRGTQSNRTKLMREAELRALYESYGIDLSSPQAFNATRALLAQEQQTELMHKLLGLGRAHSSSRELGPMSQAVREFNERARERMVQVDGGRVDRSILEARRTAQNVPGRTEEAPAKNFTVDDEIEARQATFEATLDEVNAMRGYEPLTDAPSDAPTPSDADAPHENSSLTGDNSATK